MPNDIYTLIRFLLFYFCNYTYSTCKGFFCWNRFVIDAEH